MFVAAVVDTVVEVAAFVEGMIVIKDYFDLCLPEIARASPYRILVVVACSLSVCVGMAVTLA